MSLLWTSRVVLMNSHIKARVFPQLLMWKRCFFLSLNFQVFKDCPHLLSKHHPEIILKIQHRNVRFKRIEGGPKFCCCSFVSHMTGWWQVKSCSMVSRLRMSMVSWWVERPVHITGNVNIASCQGQRVSLEYKHVQSIPNSPKGGQGGSVTQLTTKR